MDTLDILPRLLGAFYLFGGWMGLKALAMDDALDRMLGALSAEPATDKETLRRRVLAACVLLTALSGVALMLMSRLALPLFVLNLVAQAGWLLWARTAFPPEDAEDALGRRRSRNAAIIWVAATLFVAWLDRQGRFAPFADPIPAVVVGLAALILGGWAIRQLSWDPGSLPEDINTLPDFEPPEIRHPSRIRLAPMIGDWSIWDADDGRGLHAYAYLPLDLADRIEDWAAEYEAALDPYDLQSPPRFATAAAERKHRAATAEIIALLEAIYGPDSVEGPSYADAPNADEH